MELSKKDSSIERGNEGKQGKTKKTSSVHAPTTKRSQNTTASSTRNKTSTSRALSTNISSRTKSESVVSDTSNIYQTSDGLSMPTRASRIDVDLLGLALQTSNAGQLGDAQHAFFIEPVGGEPSGECLYHLPILLMSDNVGGHRRALDPVARWLAEDHTEQCTVLLLPDGQLSIHRECQCSEMVLSGIEVELEE